jgi:hypothetical protein
MRLIAVRTLHGVARIADAENYTEVVSVMICGCVAISALDAGRDG